MTCNSPDILSSFPLFSWICPDRSSFLTSLGVSPQLWTLMISTKLHPNLGALGSVPRKNHQNSSPGLAVRHRVQCPKSRVPNPESRVPPPFPSTWHLTPPPPCAIPPGPSSPSVAYHVDGQGPGKPLGIGLIGGHYARCFFPIPTSGKWVSRNCQFPSAS